MANFKKINLSKFFRQDTQAPSAVGVTNTGGGLNPQAQIAISGQDLSQLLEIIQSTTEITKVQEQLITKEDNNDSLLQGVVNTLQRRIFTLETSLYGLTRDFQSDLLDRKKLKKEKELVKIIKEREDTERTPTIEPRTNIFDMDETPTDVSDGGETNFSGGFAALGGALIGGGLGSFLGQDQNQLNGDFSGGGTYDVSKLKKLAESVGFRGENAAVAAAVAKAESGGDPNIDTVKSGLDPQMKNEFSIGLWQINWLAHKNGTLKKMGVTNPSQLYDPVTNAKAAYLISGGSNFKPWSVYSKGSYKQYLQEAIQSPSSSNAAPQIQSSGADGNQSSLPQTQTQTQTQSIAQSVPPNQPQIQGRTTTTGQAIAESSPEGINAAPIILATNPGRSGTPSQMEISSGSAIPSGFTANMNNFYPAVTRSIFGIA
jgi:hypothetical protein